MTDDNQAMREVDTRFRPRPVTRTEEHGEPLTQDMRGAANQVHERAIQLRTMARRDAIITICRARERRGAKPTEWSGFDSDAIFLLSDLLIRLQGGAEEPIDPSFAIRDSELAKASAQTSRLEEALKKPVD